MKITPAPMVHDNIARTLIHRQPGGSGRGVVVIMLVVFCCVVVAGILAAIFVESFEDYGVRARMNGIYDGLQVNRTPMQEFATKNGAWPTTWTQVESAGGKNPIDRLQPEIRALVEEIRLDPNGVMVAAVKINGKTGQIRLVPAKTGSEVEWTCSASPDINWFAPLPCRSK